MRSQRIVWMHGLYNEGHCVIPEGTVTQAVIADGMTTVIWDAFEFVMSNARLSRHCVRWTANWDEKPEFVLWNDDKKRFWGHDNRWVTNAADAITLSYKDVQHASDVAEGTTAIWIYSVRDIESPYERAEQQVFETEALRLARKHGIPPSPTLSEKINQSWSAGEHPMIALSTLVHNEQMSVRQ